MSLPFATRRSCCVKVIAASPQPCCMLGSSPAPLLPQPWLLLCTHSNCFVMPASDALTLPSNRLSRAFVTCMACHFTLTLPSSSPPASTSTYPFVRKLTAKSRWLSGERELIGGLNMHAPLTPITSKMNQSLSSRCCFVWMGIIR